MPSFTDINASNIFHIVDDSQTLSSIVAGFTVIIIVGLLSLFNKNLRLFYKSLIDKFFTKSEAFEVLNLRKHITLCANGHLIVLHDFKLRINDKETTERFSREFDVSDGAKKCKLPIFKTMMNTDKKERFKNYGFWYRSNPENIFAEVKEDNTGTNSNKTKKFYFRFNKNVLKNLTKDTIKLMYGYSVKYGQPLTNGYYDKDLANDPTLPNIIESAFKVRYRMNTLEYIFSFIEDIKIIENNIKVYYYPDGIDNEHTKKLISIDKKDDLYYNKFSFIIDKPKLNSIVKIKVPIEYRN